MNEFNGRQDTFYTSIDSYTTHDIEEAEQLKLPEVVNFVAIRESCLSEAPFVSKTNRKIWKRCIDSSAYVTIFASTLKILMECISESGSVNQAILYDTTGYRLLYEKMSVCMSEMLVTEKKSSPRQLDNLVRRLPELLCYMIVNSLHSCLPRQGRVFNIGKFRELLLDWLTELICGLRLTNPRADRYWLFSDTNDTPIVILGQPPSTAAAAGTSSLPRNTSNSSLPMINSNATATNSIGYSATVINEATNRQITTATTKSFPKLPPATAVVAAVRNLDASHYSGAKACLSLENSPLIRAYMNLGRNPELNSFYQCQHPAKVIITTHPNRTLTLMQPECILSTGNFRERAIVKDQFTATIKSSTRLRKDLLKDFDTQKKTMKRELQRANMAYNVQMVSEWVNEVLSSA